MSGHAARLCSEVRDLNELRAYRQTLCRKVMYRQRRSAFLAELQAVTCEILKRELQAERPGPRDAEKRTPESIEPLGDVPASRRSCLPYKD